MNATPIYTFPRALTQVTIHARPSSVNKSPYLVDIQLPCGEIHQAHNPALGAGGLVTVGATAYVMPSSPESRGLSKYNLLLIQLEDDTLVCVNPQVGNKVAEQIIANQFVIPDLESYQQEVTVKAMPQLLARHASHDMVTVKSNLDGESRFDFAGQTTTGEQFYIEVKSAPIADIVDCMPRDRARKLKDLPTPPPLFTIFPYGNTRKAGLISPRALKHAQHLTKIQQAAQAKTALLYLSMRPDVSHFQISEIDTEYNAAVAAAHAAGVLLKSYALRFTAEGDVFIEKELDIHI